MSVIKQAIKNKNQVISGLKNHLLDSFGFTDDDKQIIFSQRKNVCDVCPLKEKDSCSYSKVLSKEDMKTSLFDKKNMKLVFNENEFPKEKYITKDNQVFYRGCGCNLNIKQKSDHPDTHCPAGFWGREFIKQ